MFDSGHQIFIFILLFFILSYGSCLVKLQCDLSQKIVIFASHLDIQWRTLSWTNHVVGVCVNTDNESPTQPI